MLAFNKDQFLVEVALATTIKNRLAAIDTTTKDYTKYDNSIDASDLNQPVIFVEQWKKSGRVCCVQMNLGDAIEYAKKEIQRLWVVHYDFYIIRQEAYK